MRSSASFAMAGPIGARDAALSMRCGSPQLRTESSPSTGQSQSPKSSRSGGIGGPRLGRDGQSCLTIEDDVIGLVVRAVGYGAEREHFGHGEMLSRPGGQQVGAVHHRRQCVEALDL